MEGIYSSETSVDFHPTTRRYIPEIQLFEILNSDSFQVPVNIFIDLVQVA
jgi:hypothetical protein